MRKQQRTHSKELNVENGQGVRQVVLAEVVVEACARATEVGDSRR